MIDSTGRICIFKGHNNELCGERYRFQNLLGDRQCTRYTGTRYQFAKGQQRKGIIVLIFVRSDKNAADLFTKHLGKELYSRHTSSYMQEFHT